MKREELPAAAAKMGAAFADYRQWIEQRLPNMPHAQPIGRELYDWILRRVWLLPFDANDIRRMGEQEYGRYLSFTAFEEARNRGLPPQRACARRPITPRRRSRTSRRCERSCKAEMCLRSRTSSVRIAAR